MLEFLFGSHKEVATVHHPSWDDDSEATVTIGGRHHENVTEASMERLYSVTSCTVTYSDWRNNEDGSQDQPLKKRGWFW